MKRKIKELNVDFIDGQGNPLTKEEEQAISKYLKSSKKNQEKLPGQHKNRLIKRRSKTFEK